MDKKRRNKNNYKLVDFYNITELEYSTNDSGLLYKRYRFKYEYGNGYYDFYNYDGLYVSCFNVELKKDIVLEGAIADGVLLASFLMDGQQIINVENIDKDFIYEKEESYLVYLPNIHESILYRKNCNLKQVSIIMDSNFLKKHKLFNDIESLNIMSLIQNENLFMTPICSDKQEILSAILNNNQKGLIKRLFLESKSLELVSLMLDKNKYKKSLNGMIKKLYNVQHFISLNLDTNFTIHELSNKFLLNEFVLKKEFKQLFGKTIFEYSVDLKMKKAKEFLDNSQKPIYEISELIGYKNATHFSAAFKKNEGVTPKQYQKLKKYSDCKV